jgi:hypothetical protein
MDGVLFKIDFERAHDKVKLSFRKDSHLSGVNGLQDLFLVGVLKLKLMMVLDIISKQGRI